MEATMSTKGQVTIPKRVRTELGLHSGSRISFLVIGNRAEITPVTTPITALKGILPKPKKSLSLSEIEGAIAEGALNGRS